MYHSNLAFFSYFPKNKAKIKKVVQKTKRRAQKPDSLLVKPYFLEIKDNNKLSKRKNEKSMRS